MKQKNSSSQPLTKGDLESALTKYATKGDLLVLKNEIVGEIDGKLETMGEKHKLYRDEVMTKLDDIAGQLGVMRDENVIGSGQTSALREEIEDHDKRIKILEKLQVSA